MREDTKGVTGKDIWSDPHPIRIYGLEKGQSQSVREHLDTCVVISYFIMFRML